VHLYHTRCSDTQSPPLCAPCVCEILITAPQRIPIEPVPQPPPAANIEPVVGEAVNPEVPTSEDAVVAVPATDYDNGDVPEPEGELIPPRPASATVPPSAITAGSNTSSRSNATRVSGEVVPVSSSHQTGGQQPHPHQYMRPNPYAAAINGTHTTRSGTATAPASLSGVPPLPRHRNHAR
jgi:hypothetical protein